MATAAHYLTEEQFAALPDLPGKQELLGGELLTSPPAAGWHRALSRRLEEALRPLESAGFVVLCEAGVRLPRTADGQELASTLQPDVIVFNRAQWEAETHPSSGQKYPQNPVFVIEVISPANRRAKIERKVRTYLANGVYACWVVDPPCGVHIFHPDGTVEKNQTTVRTPAPLPEVTLDFNNLFGV